MTGTEASDADFGVEVSIGVVAQFVMALIGFAGTIIFANILGPAQFGGFYLLLSLLKIADRPIDGWANAAKKRFSESESSKDEILGAQWLVSSGAVLLGIVLIFLFRSVLESYTGLVRVTSSAILLFGTVVFFFPFQRILSSTGQEGLVRWIDTGRSVLTLPLQLAFVFAGFGAAGMAYGLASATLLSIPITLYFISRRPVLPSFTTIRSLWRYARYSIPNIVIGKAYDRYDILLIGFLLSPSIAGEYEVAYKLTVPGTFVASVAGAGLMARISNLRSKEKSVSMDISNTIAFASIVSLPLLFGAAAIPQKLVVTAYGPEYAGATILLVGLALFQFIYSQSFVLQRTIAGLDRPDVNFRISATTLGLNVVLGYGLALQFGAIGVVAATVVSELLRYVASAIIVRRALPGVDLFPRPLLYQVVASAVMFVIVTTLHAQIPVNSWVRLLVIVGIGAIVYATLLVAVSSQVRHTIISILPETYANRLA